MGNKVLSVVIPAYNMEKYIKQTLDSLICDEYMDKLEVLVIDDGSKDDTAAIAKTYEDRYPGTFRVVSKENGGHGSALNKGIELATGKYYRPLDADDWVDTAALKAVIAEMEAHDADMVLTNFKKVYEKTQKTENVRISNVWNRKQIDEGKAVPKPGRKVLIYGQVYDFDKELFDYSKQYLFHFVSYRTQILKDNNIRFDEHVFYDDMEYDIFPLPYVKTVLPIDRYLYQYRLEREGQSVDQSSFARNNKHRRKIVEHITEYYVKNKDLFSPNVYNYLREDILWKIVRQYDIYLTLMKNNSETCNELMGFARTIQRIDQNIYNETCSRRIRLIMNSNGILFPLVASRSIQQLNWKYKLWKNPNPAAKAWTMESDKPMHRMITRRRILKALHLTWLNKDMRNISRFKNIHKGERCFITCPGPSMTIKDLELLKDEYTIGVNSITKAYAFTDWRPTYYALVDSYAFGKTLSEKEVPGNTFCQREAFFHYRVNPKTRNGRETHLLIDYSNHRPDWMAKHRIKYSDDMSVCAYDGFTVTNMAIQLAIYMGFSKIYIIGADCDYSQPKIHFIEVEDDKDKISGGWLPAANDLGIEGYKAMKKFAYKHGCEIYNVTRGGKLEVFYRDNLERVLRNK